MESFICLEEIDEIYNLDVVAHTKRIQTPAKVEKQLLNDKRVLSNMLKSEKQNSINDYCNKIQTEIAPHMRKIVTDWMLEVCEDQQCQPEVFFLAVNYLDRFLSLVNIKKNQFQLLASVCILLASKFSQVIPITTDQLILYADHSITKEEMKQWELFILEILGWELSVPTVHSFLSHFVNRSSNDNSNNGLSLEVERQAESLLSLAATEYKFITTRQSMLAAAALSTAVQISQTSDQEKVFQELSDSTEFPAEEVKFYAEQMSSLLPAHNGLSSLSPKTVYKQECYSESSTTCTIEQIEPSIMTPTETFRVYEVMAA